ncbi:MAG TPA: multicopper oxidase domain-containing protein, partial [Dokdonella sp.]|nr:multicopper oxidase domain-containing protein [Dokdonella sp.]
MKQNRMLGIALAGLMAMSMLSFQAEAKTVKITLHAQEVDLPIDNKGTMYRSWTFDGKVPGPLVRVTEGDTVEFTLINDKANKNSHSIDFHAASLDVVTDFGSIKPGEEKKFTFTANYPGVFFYHCGSDPMIQHIARGMFGTIIVDPKDASAMPKADREYVLIQSELYPNPDAKEEMMQSKWSKVMF